MIRPFELLVGFRYIRARRSTRFISFITTTSVLGIIIGVWALISVLAVMNGFERELKSRILTVASHIQVTGSTGWLSNWRQVMSSIEEVRKIDSQSPFIISHGMLKTGNKVSPVIIRGVDPIYEANVSSIGDHLVTGELQDLKSGEFGIILGEELARRLNVATVGEKVILISSVGRSTPAGVIPRVKKLTVVGIFNLNFYEYDNGLALVNIDDLAVLQRIRSQVSGLRLKTEDVFQTPLIAKELRAVLGNAYRVRDWTREYSNLFEALKIERRVMFIILLLIIAVAAFNIVSSLVMLVADKKSDIAVLRTIGASPKSIMTIFIVHGLSIGIVGTIAGVIAGVITGINLETLIPWAENLFSTEFFPDDIYIISKFPAELVWDDVIKIAIASTVLSLLATIYPAWRASKVQPAEALRYD